MSIKTNTTSLQNLLEQVNSLPEAGGVELPTLTNEGSASDLLSGKELIDQEGNVVTGTIETKTASNLTASGATVTVPAGYYASQATKSVATATQATPSVSINSNGLITASATQAAGYVAAGTKSGTKQLTTQAAKTVTPTKSSQTAVSSGVYTTGTITVAAIPNEYIITTDATAEASEIMSGETAYVNGSKVTGTFTLEDEISIQDGLIAELSSILDSKAAGGGIELPELSNEGVADDLVTGKELINSNGDIVIGTNPYVKAETDADVATEADLIAQITTALQGKTALKLNFSVVGGTTQPENPTENTIWVETDQAITDWILSPDQPENPTEGMVWVRVGTTGTQIECVPGAISLHISSVLQYSSDWEEMEADIYQGGVWLVAAQTRFYYLGNTFESVTGGYTAVGSYTSLNKLSESMLVTGVHRTLTRFRSANQIDMTPFRSLVFAFDSFTYTDYTSVNTGALVTSQVGVGDETAAQPLTAYSTPAKQGTPQQVEVDVSGVTGAHYICVSAGNGDENTGHIIITAIYAY